MRYSGIMVLRQAFVNSKVLVLLRYNDQFLVRIYSRGLHAEEFDFGHKLNEAEKFFTGQMEEALDL